MKKLVLLVSVFLLVAGMVAADVTFAPTVTGSTSLTWGADFSESNTGFDAANSASLDLNVTVDPVDAKAGAAFPYGEVAISGLAVTAKSDADVVVATPAIDAKLWFSEALYATISTGMSYDWAVGIADFSAAGNDLEATWEDEQLEIEAGNAGAGFTFMAGDLTVNAAFVSEDKWGTSDVKKEFKIADYDTGLVDGEKEDGILADNLTEYQKLVADVNAQDTAKYDYQVKATPVVVDGATMYQVELDGSLIKVWREEIGKKDAGQYVSFVDLGDKANSNLYTFGLDVAYTITDLGYVKAYVLPTNDDKDNLFDNINFGVMANIAPAAFSMASLNVAADFVVDQSANDFSYEVAVTVPVMVGDMLTANAKAAFSDDAADELQADLYVDAAVMAAGATVKGAFQMNDVTDAATKGYTVNATYPVAVGAGTVTPTVDWGHDLDANKGILTASVAADIVENVTFTAQLKTGDLFAADLDMGEFTFVTAFAY